MHNPRDMIAYDEEGEHLFPWDEFYSPGALLRAAFPEYHSKQGQPGFLLLSVIFLALGWCTFRYEAFQNFLFQISPTRLYVVDWEPNDFYFFMCKVSGVVLMGWGVVYFSCHYNLSDCPVPCYAVM